MSKKLESTIISISAVLILAGIFIVMFGIRYTWLNYTPCSFHSVKDAPVRCLKGETER